MKRSTKAAVKLLEDGTIALADVEATGIVVDRKRLRAAITRTAVDVAALKMRMEKDEKVYGPWKRMYGDRVKIGSRDQMKRILFGELGYKPIKKTDTGRDALDKETLNHIDEPFVRDFLKHEELKKINSTYLVGLDKELVQHRDGMWRVHPIYNLNSAVTYRSCVAAGTRIEVVRDVSKSPKGRKIENVRAGDHVYCYDEDLNLCIRKVLWAGKTGHRKVVRLHWSARGKKGHLDLTPEHRIRMASGEYVEARHLKPGADFRKPGESRHSPRIRTLAMGRVRDHLFQTGKKECLYDHRLVYEHFHGPLAKEEVVHHKDENHLNNRPGNLEKHTYSTHGKVHGMRHITAKHRRKALRVRNERIASGDIVFKKGEDNPMYINLSRFALLRVLAENSGRISKGDRHTFTTIKDRAAKLGVDLKAVAMRYGADRKFISRGRLRRKCRKYGIRNLTASLGVSYYKAKKLLDYYGMEVRREYANQTGRWFANNHKITAIEYLTDKVDVYDLEVEEFHNFIANEICVHNSCQSPNLQNQPVRNPVAAELVRSCFVAPPGFHFAECDFSGIEVKVSACVHKDPNMVRYIKDPTTDMHRDQAMRLFKLTKEQVWKKTTRDFAKNMWVFPQFYGSVYFQCAPNIWEAMNDPQRNARVGESGIPILQHLRGQGVTRLGDCEPRAENGPDTFVHRARQVEKEMWEKDFPVYTKWKRDTWEQYQREGGVSTRTGFRVNLHMKRNEVLNLDIQGSAFHCLLWCVIQMTRHIKRWKMRSRVIGQIHDSALGYVHGAETDEYFGHMKWLMTEALPQQWKWITVPLETESEASPVGGSWAGKKVWVETDGTWSQKA